MALAPVSAEVGCSDCVALADLEEATLLGNLCLRYDHGLIYTYVAHVLLAINPYKVIRELYAPEALASYISGTISRHVPRPPHVYAVAADALAGLRRGEQQAILISGESGAGKSETAKTVLRFLESAMLPATTSTCDGERVSAQGILLAMGDVLESFGHASTRRNQNSSRFGKYLRLRPVHGRMRMHTSTYLLEVGRSALVPLGERNFHVFYEILAGLSTSERQRLQLSPAEWTDFVVLGGYTPAMADRDGLRRLYAAYEKLGLDGENFADLATEVLAGLLHLGNVIAGDGIGDELKLSARSVAVAAPLLGLEVDDLRKTLLFRRLTIRGRQSIYETPRSLPQAKQVVRSLIATIYGVIFSTLVRQLNAHIALLPGADNRPSGADLGVLDIFGFEVLGRNLFEQLLINFANERLQHFFVERALVEEHREHLQEGIKLRGGPTLDAEGPSLAVSAVLDLLDDLGRLASQGLGRLENAVATLVDGFRSGRDQVGRPSHSLTKIMWIARASSHNGQDAKPCFAVRHSAGDVQYELEGLVESNDARLAPDVDVLLASSSKCDFVRPHEATSSGSKHSSRSVSREYRRELSALLLELRGRRTHFVRCFRPNACEVPDCLDKPYLLEQLRSCGTMELLRVMSNGYPHRVPIAEVAARFAVLLPETMRLGSPRTIVHSLMLAYQVPKTEWTVGFTKLFLRAGQMAMMSELRMAGSPPSRTAIRAAAREVNKCRWRRAVTALAFAAWLPRYVAARRKARAVRRRCLRSVFLLACAVVRLRRLAVTRSALRATKPPSCGVSEALTVVVAPSKALREPGSLLSPPRRRPRPTPLRAQPLALSVDGPSQASYAVAVHLTCALEQPAKRLRL